MAKWKHLNSEVKTQTKILFKEDYTQRRIAKKISRNGMQIFIMKAVQKVAKMSTEKEEPEHQKQQLLLKINTWLLRAQDIDLKLFQSW